MGWLVLGFYLLFTLLPDSNTKVVSWPWVFLWQAALLTPIAWLLVQVAKERQWRWLGNHLDWLMLPVPIVLFASTLQVEFPNQARWYAWAAFCVLTTIYALNFWLQSAQRRLWLLQFQGYLGLAFILVSLLLWSGQTFFPELARLQELAQVGVQMPFSFFQSELRNWAPIGHANYVAGYLVLLLPLLAGLCLLQSGRQRWIWATGLGLGGLDLLTTNSRGGLLGLIVALLVGFALLSLIGCLNRRSWLWFGGLLVLAGLAGFSNSRLRTQLLALASGQLPGDFYRSVTTTVGMQMGLDHPWFGAGPGSVPLLFQKYRPAWAGREVELTFQLHNTPVQIWAELGLAGVLVLVATTVLLSYLGARWLWQVMSQKRASAPSDRILIPIGYTSLIAYGCFSLTDYQLDNLCISGVLVLFLAVLASALREPLSLEAEQSQGNSTIWSLDSRRITIVTAASAGLLIGICVWLAPIQWGWNVSSQGFLALRLRNIGAFVQFLTQAQRLVPWEPYYPLQLGWNLGNLSLNVPDPKQQQALQQTSLQWLNQGTQLSPHQEFGYTNLGWLVLNQNPGAAETAFIKAAQLVPAKRGVFYGLGFSLLAQGKLELAIAALTLEAVRDPLLITSPIWRSPQFQSLYPKILDGMEQLYSELLKEDANSATLVTLLHQCRGGVRWWRGNLIGAAEDWLLQENPLNRIILELANGKTVTDRLTQILPPDRPRVRQSTPGWPLIIAAWLNPEQRLQLLQQGWVLANDSPLTPELQAPFLASMAQSTTLDQWLKQNAPVRQYRRERPGFGPLNRHIDGPAPIDFLTVQENIPMTRLFDRLLPSPLYLPEWDQVLQPRRDQFLASLGKP